MKLAVTALLVAPALMAVPAASHANPRALPFTYTSDTLPAGGVEIEQYVDIDPLRTHDPVSGAKQYYLSSAFFTEVEIGLAERLELGLYMTYVPDPGEEFVGKAIFPGEGNGLKQRLRYILANPGEWPVDVGTYGEVSENEREIELEAKILLQRRFDRIRVAVNLSGEYEWYFSGQREWVINPSAGVTYEVTPKLHVGLDSWMRGEYPLHPKPATRTFGLGPETYVGPAIMNNFGRLWWSVGAYVRVTDFNHDLTFGEPYGPLYFRSMIGYDL